MILVIDDDMDIRDSLAETLRVEGYEVLTAVDGSQALELLQKGLRPKLILLDLMMPVMNGWKFLETVHERPEYAAIPVVVSTAMTSKEDSVQFAAAFIKKPMDLASLLDFVRKYCGPPMEKSA